MKTDKMFCVHTIAFLGAFMFLFKFNIWQLCLLEFLSCHSKVFPPFFRESRTRSAWSNTEVSLLVRSIQGQRSNFEIGGGGGSTISDSILGGHKTLFLTKSL